MPVPDYSGYPKWIKGVLSGSTDIADEKEYDVYLESEHDMQVCDMSTFVDDDWKNLETAIKTVCPAETKRAEWLAAARSGNTDALEGALLPLLVELEQLNVEASWSLEGVDTRFVAQSLAAVAASQQLGQQPLLPKLTRVKMTTDMTEEGFYVLNFLPFLRPPSVESFEAWACSDDYWDGQGAFETNVKQLTFESSSFSMESMRHMLSCFPKLEHFSFEYGGCTRGQGGEFVPREFAGMLQPFKDTLRLLKIEDTESQEVQLENGWEYAMPAGTLTSFTALKTIVIEKRMLFGKAGSVLTQGGPARQSYLPNVVPGSDHVTTIPLIQHYDDDDDGEEGEGRRGVRLVDAIPKSLTSLQLTSCRLEDVIEDLVELAARKEEVAPVLNHITFAGLAAGKPHSVHFQITSGLRLAQF